jgi:tetratricopeptide (TPR) repeat protein
MRQIITSILIIFLAINTYGQNDKVLELIYQGIELHDQGKYDEAISKYKSALKIDKKSTFANYEISFTYFLTQQYEEAIKHSKFVINKNEDNMLESYIVLGNSLDLIGKPTKAISTYEEGLSKFPNSNLLNYNLALTCYNQRELDKAEKAVINAIIAKPLHGSSHIVLSAIMQEKGQRIKSVLPLYYFLMLEPNSKRSLPSYNSLISQLGQGVEKKDDKNISISVPLSSSSSSDFDAAEMMISMLAAAKYTEEKENKNEMELFVDTNKGLFSVLVELKKDNQGFWWDLYVKKFHDLLISENNEAFSYYISQSTNNETVNIWIKENTDKMQKLIDWLNE